MNPRSEWRTRHLRLAVANRDGWLCYRCIQAGKPPDDCRIDPRLRYPHKRCVSLEHVLPEGVTLAAWIAQGGDPYDPAICTVSHKTCNLSAGARDGNRLRNLPRLPRLARRTELTW